MYEINNNTEVSSGSSSLGGIHENFEIVDISYGPSGKDGNGVPALKFTIKKGDRFIVSWSEFAIDEARVANYSKQKDGKELSKAEKIKAAYDDQAAKIKHILMSFMASKDIVIKGATFKEFAESIVKLAGDKYKGKKIRVKLVFNPKGYLTVPKTAKRAFIESMDIAKEKSPIKVDPRYDIIEKPSPDTEAGEEAAMAAAGEQEDDLPF